MGLAILGIALLLYILLAYFAAKTWQVWHVVLLVFLFIFGFVFCFLASATLKVQQQWRSQYVLAVRDIETERENNERLTMGALGGGEPGQIELRGDVKRMLVDRGRVWRNLRLADLGDGQVLLDASAWDQSGCVTSAGVDDAEDAEFEEEEPAPDEAAAAEPPPGHGLEADAVVYAFKEAPIRTLSQPLQATLLSTDQVASAGGDLQSDEDGDYDEEDYGDSSGASDALGCKVPTFYMGEYKVVVDPDTSADAVMLEPTMPLSEEQIAQLQDPESTWVLYEVMPVDTHEAFVGMPSEQLSQLISAGSIEAERYRRLIESYTRDLQSGTDMDPPERKWMTIKFTQTEAIEVDVEIADDPTEQPLADSLFDPSGRALVATLSQGETTVFQEGDEATFDFATAQELIGQGKAEPVKPIYHRRLRDYARSFRSLDADLDELTRQTVLAQSDLDKLDESVSQLQTQLTFQTQQRQKIASDHEGLTNERQILDQYAGMVEKKWNELRADLSRIYRSNRQLVSRLTAVK